MTVPANEVILMRTISKPDHVTAFANLPHQASADLMEVMSFHAYRKGQNLFYQGQEPQAVWFVESGQVKWFKVSEDGREQILQVAGPGEAVGLVALLDRKPYVAAAKAVGASTAWSLTISDFERMVIRHPELALFVMRQLGDGVRWLIEHVHSMQHRSAHDRVTAVLLHRAEPDEDGKRIVRLTHQEIAQIAGVARETVSRVLSDLQRRGAVALTRSQVQLLDVEEVRGVRGDPEVH